MNCLFEAHQKKLIKINIQTSNKNTLLTGLALLLPDAVKRINSGFIKIKNYLLHRNALEKERIETS